MLHSEGKEIPSKASTVCAPGIVSSSKVSLHPITAGWEKDIFPFGPLLGLVQLTSSILHQGFPGGSGVKASAYNEGDPGLIPGSERSPGEGNGNPLQYSCLENPMDREAR